MPQVSAFPDDEQEPGSSVPSPGTLTSRPAGPGPSGLSAFPDDPDDKLTAGMQRAPAIGPDNAARVFNLQTKTGLPVEVIRRNLDEVEKKAAAVDFDPVAFRKSAPSLAGWIERDPDHGALVHDDIVPLTALEQVLKFGSTAGTFGKEAVFSTAAGISEHINMGAWGTLEAAGDVFGMPAVRDYGKARGLEAKQIGAALRGDRPGMGQTAKAALGGFESVGASAPIIFATIISKNPSAALTLMGFQTGAPAYSEARAEGRDILPSLAYGAAQGLVEAATEKLPIAKLFGDLAAKSGIIKTLAHQLLLEIPGEQLATALQDLNEWAVLHPDKPFQDYLDARKGAFWDTFVGTLVATGVQTGATHTLDRAMGGGRSKTLAEDLGGAVTGAKLPGRSPAKFEELVNDLAKDSPAKEVYAPVETFTEYYQGLGLDPAAVAAELTGSSTAYAEAQQTGADLVIPIGRYASRIAGTEHNAFFANEIRLAPGEMNGREHEMFLVEQSAAGAEGASEAENVSGTTPEPSGTGQTADLVGSRVASSLRASGVAPAVADRYAAWWGAAYHSGLVARAKLDPVATFEEGGLRIERPSLADAGAVAARRVASRRGTGQPPQPAGGAPAPGAEATGAETPNAPASLDGLGEIEGFDDLLATLGTAALLEAPDGPTTPNFSGSGMGSTEEDLRLAGMKERGESFVVYDRAGNERTLLAGGIDYNAQPGETYGVKSPRGFELRDDRGGRVPFEVSSPRGAQTGEGPPDADGERGRADADRDAESGSDGPRAQRRRFPTAVDLAAGDAEAFRKADPDVDAGRLTPGVNNELARMGEELEQFEFVPRSWSYLEGTQGKTGNAAGGAANIAAGAPGAPVYDDVLEFSPLNKGTKGEATAKTVHGTRGAVKAAIRKVLATGVIHNNLAEGAVRVAERRDADDYRELSRPVLPPSWGVEATAELTDGLSAGIDAELDRLELNAADLEGEGDPTFDPTEFQQAIDHEGQLIDALGKSDASELMLAFEDDVRGASDTSRGVGKVEAKRRLSLKKWLESPAAEAISSSSSWRTLLARGRAALDLTEFKQGLFDNLEPEAGGRVAVGTEIEIGGTPFTVTAINSRGIATLDSDYPGQPTIRQPVSELEAMLPEEEAPTPLGQELNAQTWHHGGGAPGVATASLRPPVFLTTSTEGAAWFVTNRGEGTGTIQPVRVNVRNPLPLGSYAEVLKLRDILTAAGIAVEITPDTGEGWTWNVPAVAESSPYEGTNPLDVVYIPAARAAILAAGYDAVYDPHDVLENGSIPALVTLAPGAATAVDVLDTGEQQPRLPGAGAVRDQDIATPTFEAPFSLTSQVAKRKGGGQTSLFQRAKPPHSAAIAPGDEYQTDLFGNDLEPPDDWDWQPGDPLPGEPPAPALPAGHPLQRDEVPGTFPTRTILVEAGRKNLTVAGPGGTITTAADVALAMSYLAKGPVERFDILMLDAAGTPLAVVGGYKGDVGTVRTYIPTTLSEMYRVKGATQAWLVHNHPSGFSKLSGADGDQGVLRTYSRVMRGGDLALKGIIAIGSDDKGGQSYSYEETQVGTKRAARGDGLVADARHPAGRKDKPLRTVSVPVLERELATSAKMENRDAITSTYRMAGAVDEIASGRFGVVLTDSQLQPIGFVPFDPAEARELRTKGRIDALFRAISISAPEAVLINDPVGTMGSLNGALNLAKAFNASGLRVLDIITGGPGGAPTSYRANLPLPKDTEFFQPAYHGTPHKFEKFSLHAMGTGEGAQAYGWGLYFAGKKAVAEYYRQNLSGAGQITFTGLTPEENDLLPTHVKEDIGSAVEMDPRKTMPLIDKILADYAVSIAQEEALLVPVTEEQAAASRASGWGSLLTAGKMMSRDPVRSRRDIARFHEIVGALAKLKTVDEGEVFHHRERPGRLYTVEIPDDPDFLSWDLPASQQSEKVQAALRALGVTWDTFKPKTPKQFLAWTKTQVFDRLWREDIGIRESLQEGIYLAQGDDVAAFNRWQGQHQGYTSRGMVDPTGSKIYERLTMDVLNGRVPAKVGAGGDSMTRAAQGASELLAGAGLAGIRYLDGSSRRAGEGAQNYVVIDANLIAITEFEQPAYHGTPHDVDKFSIANIGTGQGAASFGWGLYFAENVDVARSYRDELSEKKNREVEGGGHLPNWVAEKVAHLRAGGVGAAHSIDDLIADFERRVEEAETQVANKEGQYWNAAGNIPGLKAVVEGLRNVKAGAEVRTIGGLYQVDIADEAVARMADWDLPLREQPRIMAALGLGSDLDAQVDAAFDQWWASTQAYEAAVRVQSPDTWELHLEVQRTFPIWDHLKTLRAAADKSFGAVYQAMAQGHGLTPALKGPVHAALDAGERVDKVLSEYLKAQGVPGLRFLDQGSRGGPVDRGTRNLVIFDDAVVTITHKDGSPVTEAERAEFLQEKTPPDLVVTHNLSASNLLHALKMGGIAVPSLAITPKDRAITGFGEITLIGGSALADPQRGAKVFGADVYSPRYPRIHIKTTKAGEKLIGGIVTATADVTGQKWLDLDEVRTSGARALKDIPGVMVQFLRDNDLDVPAITDEERRNASLMRRRLELAVETSVEQVAQFDAYVALLFDQMGNEEQIFRGFTNQGNRSYKPHTLENVVAILKKELRGGESQSNLYGVGQLRAKFTPQFKSLAGIRAAKGRLVDRAQFEALKEEVEQEFFAVAKALEGSYGHSVGFQFSETVMAVMEDAPRKGLTWALKEYGFTDVPADVQTAIGEFLAKLRTMPTEYFEVKHTRAVGLAEFEGAVVPEDVDPKVLEALKRSGIRVATYAKGDDATRRAAVDALATGIGPAVLFQEPQAPTRRAPDARGSITFGRDRQFTINLFAAADLSTVLHESGHFFLELMGDVGKKLEALETRDPEQAQILLDLAALRGLLQTTPGEMPAAHSQWTATQHEDFARMTEAYLLEGVAPSEELKPFFQSFKQWLTAIYSNVLGLERASGQKIVISPEVRQVFDRLFASEQQLAKVRREVVPIFATAAEAGMGAHEFALYLEQIERANLTARDLIDRRLMRDVHRQQTAAWRAQREAIEAAVVAELNDAPVYKALAAMQRGTKPDGTSLLEGETAAPMRLSRTMLIEQFGKARLKGLPRPYIYSAEGGLDPRLAAEVFEFSSADAMLNELAAATPYREVLEGEVNRRMIEQHGDTLLDGTLPAVTDAATSNADRETVIRAEIRALQALRKTLGPAARAGAKDATAAATKERDYERRWFEAEAKLAVAVAEGRKQVEIDKLTRDVAAMRTRTRGAAPAIRRGIPNERMLREAAIVRIGATTIENIRPRVWFEAAKRSGREAVNAAAAGNIDRAIEMKTQELFSLALHREGTRVLDELEPRVQKAKDLGKPAARARLGLAGDTYLDQIDGVLDRFEFARVSEKVLSRRAGILKFVEGIQGEGLPADLPAELLDEALRTNYRKLTVDALTGVLDGIDQIIHLARLKNRLLKAKDKRELDEVAGELGANIRDKFTGKTRNRTRDRRPSEERLRAIDSFFASHRKLASIVRELDGFIDGGPMWEAVSRAANAAGDAEAEQYAAATVALHDLVEASFPGLAKGRLYEKVEIKAVGRSLSRMERIMIALNWGNEGNRERVRVGEKWTDVQAEAVINSLEAADLAFVQGVFDFFETYRPAIGAKQKRVTGLEPTWVESTPIKTRHGEYRGGYFPIKGDDRLSAGALKKLDLDAANLAKHAAVVQATTRRGHLIERVGGGKDPLRLDFGVIFEHTQQVIHDLTHHEMLIDVGRILGHKDVQTAIYETHGDQVYKDLRGHIRDIAFGDVPAANGVEKGLAHLRAGATIVGLGWNLSSALMQPLGLTVSMRRVGVKWVAKGVGKWMRDSAHLENTVAWVHERSTFMRHRHRTQQREINEIRNAIGVETGRFSAATDAAFQWATFGKVDRAAIADSYFFLISRAQMIADVPTWLGAYEKAMAADPSGDEQRAVALADQAVLDTQGGGQIKDLASVQKGGPYQKLWTNFYSAFNVFYQQAVEAKRATRFKDPVSVGRLAVDYFLIFIAPASLGWAIKQALKAGDDDDDERFSWGSLARENVSYAMGTMLGLRELSGAVQGYQGYEGPAGARAFATAGKLVRQGEKFVGSGFDPDNLDAAFWRSVTDSAGLWFHFPTGQTRRTLEGTAALIEGDTSNPAALISGAPR